LPEGLEPGGFAPELMRGAERYVWYGFIPLFLGVLDGALALQSRWEAADDVEAKRGLNIAGWALAELPALLGALYLMIRRGSDVLRGRVGFHDPRGLRAAAHFGAGTDVISLKDFYHFLM
jgi:hypothetical protein